MRRLLLLVPALPSALPLAILWLLVGLVAGEDWRFDSPILKWTLKPWAAKRWRYTTRLMFVEISHPSHKGSKSIAIHEDTHTRQMVDYAVLFFVVALIALAGGCDLWVFAGFLFFGPWLLLLNYVTAWLRGHHPYRGAGHEIDARCNAWELARGVSVSEKDRKRSGYAQK